jgi:large subunit ribosomal protein L19
MRLDMPDFRAGDTVKVHTRIIEGDKERIQVFQGVVLRVNRGTTDATFTVRKVSDAWAWSSSSHAHPLHRQGGSGGQRQGRRARIYYLRSLAGKAARVKYPPGLGLIPRSIRSV